MGPGEGQELREPGSGVVTTWFWPQGGGLQEGEQHLAPAGLTAKHQIEGPKLDWRQLTADLNGELDSG